MNRSVLVTLAGEATPTHRPLNTAEGAFWDAATEAGWTPSKRGWPDYFMWKDGEVAAVEVKPAPTYHLSRHQRRVARALAAHGIAVYRWDPIDGFRHVGRDGDPE